MSNTLLDEVPVQISAGKVTLMGNLSVPDNASGVVLFAHGSGSSRHSPRNRFVAQQLVTAGVATLLIDLLTETEEEAEKQTRHLRFDIDMLAGRLSAASDWLAVEHHTESLPLGYFGASTGAAAALVAASRRQRVAAIVSRGGRPDLAGDALSRVAAPTLLIVGGEDKPVIEMNQWALNRLGAPVKELVLVPGASHLFEEAGTLEEVARLATEWFTRHFGTAV
jgi:dienelactone hydrolase